MNIEIWKDERYREIHAKWRRIRNLSFNVMRCEMSDVNLTRETSAVLYLIDQTDLTQKQIAKKLGISEATLSVRMKKLEKEGYLKRVVDEKDRRKYHLETTPLAKEAMDKAIAHLNKIHEGMLADIDDEDIEHLIHLLSQVEKNLEKMKGEQDA